MDLPIACVEFAAKRLAGTTPENLFPFNHKVLKTGNDPSSVGILPSNSLSETVKRSNKQTTRLENQLKQLATNES